MGLAKYRKGGDSESMVVNLKGKCKCGKFSICGPNLVQEGRHLALLHLFKRMDTIYEMGIWVYIKGAKRHI